MKGEERFLYSTAGVTPLPEDTETRREREHREWLESLRIDSNVPKLTEADMIRGTPKWRTIDRILADAREAEEQRRERERREREAPELFVVPEPEF